MQQTRTRHVRAHAQVDQWATPVRGRHAAIRDLVGDDGHFERVVREQFQRLHSDTRSDGHTKISM